MSAGAVDCRRCEGEVGVGALKTYKYEGSIAWSLDPLGIYTLLALRALNQVYAASSQLGVCRLFRDACSYMR